MDPRFLPHNAHRISGMSFEQVDPQLRRLREQRLAWVSPLIEALPENTPGIYTLGGARQIGKSTLVKQWMSRLLSRGVPATRVAYMTGEVIDDHHTLIRLLQDELEESGETGICHLAVDEISDVDGWDRGVKFLADAGLLDRCALLLTGSDLAMIRELSARMPGRRGREARVDFHFHPLTFAESCILKGSLDEGERQVLEAGSAESVRDLPTEAWDRLERALEEYLVHGGFLTAMNDMAEEGRLRASTLATYGDWIRGDMRKRGKREESLREVLRSVMRRLGSQLTWNALARDLSIEHPATVADYVHHLQSMDVVFVQPALREDRLSAAPKKARKIVPWDPFIVHAARAWLDPSVAPYRDTVLPYVADPVTAGALIETCVASHARRHFSTYYIKGTGEVDVVPVIGNRFWPIEVKWRTQYRSKDVGQITRYPNGVIAARTRGRHEVGRVPVVSVCEALASLGAGNWPPAGLS